MGALGTPEVFRSVGRRATLALLTTVLWVGVGASARAATLPSADRAAVDAIVAQAMREGRLPGVAVKISGPKGTYERAYGVADRSTDAKLSNADHVRIASITKTFTATAVLKEVEAGRLKLSDKLEQFVPGIANGDRITVRQMLAMRSGVYDFTSSPSFLRRFTADPELAWTPQDVVAIIRAHKPTFAPGARTQYADSNYVLLGLILERVTGRPVEDVITDEVIRPAGLTQTSFPVTSAMPTPFAHGYYAGNDSKAKKIRDYTASNPKVAWTAGAMVSTLDDLHAWGRILARGTLLSKAMQAERLEFGKIPNDGPPVGYGLGILRFGDWLGHDGAIFGYSTVTMYERRTGAQITAEANLSSNFTTATMSLFGAIAAKLYPESFA